MSRDPCCSLWGNHDSNADTVSSLDNPCSKRHTLEPPGPLPGLSCPHVPPFFMVSFSAILLQDHPLKILTNSPPSLAPQVATNPCALSSHTIECTLSMSLPFCYVDCGLQGHTCQDCLLFMRSAQLFCKQCLRACHCGPLLWELPSDHSWPFPEERMSEWRRTGWKENTQGSLGFGVLAVQCCVDVLAHASFSSRSM